MDWDTLLCSICSRKIDTEKEIEEHGIVWQYAEGYVPMQHPGKRGGVNRMRIVARHQRYAHHDCLVQARKRTVYEPAVA